MRLLFLMSFFLVTAHAGGAFAQARPTSQTLEIKAKLEKDIQGSLENIIGTQLDKSSFTVGVNVRLSERGPNRPPPPKSSPSDRPLGLELGSMNVEELVRSYEKELEELRATKKDLAEREENAIKFNVDKISIDVGIDEGYPEDYQKKFETWLKSRVRRDYGAIASAALGKINKVEPKEAKSPPKTPLGHIKDLQQLIGMLVLGLLLLLGLWALGRAVLSAFRAQRELSLQSASPLALDVNSPERAVSDPPPLSLPLDEPGQKVKEIESLVTKVAFVCMELQARLNELVRVWIDSGEDGYIKIALLVDAMMTAREKMLSQAGAMPLLQIPIDEDIASSREEHLAEAYRRVIQMTHEERSPILEKIYWDLIAVRTLGLQSLRRPFDYLTGIETEKIQTLLQQQKQESRALALLYMNESTRFELFDKAGNEDKEKMIREVLVHSQITQQEIWDSDTAVKVTIMNSAEPNQSKMVNLFPRTLDVLSVLNSLDEIRILRRVTPSLPDQGHDLKVQYPSLAFIDEWRSEYLSKLVGIATADEITSLIRVLPETKNQILSLCSEKVKVIVEDDLKMSLNDGDSSLAPKIKVLKAKWVRLLHSEKIQMLKVFKTESLPGGRDVKAA